MAALVLSLGLRVLHSALCKMGGGQGTQDLMRFSLSGCSCCLCWSGWPGLTAGLELNRALCASQAGPE